MGCEAYGNHKTYKTKDPAFAPTFTPLASNAAPDLTSPALVLSNAPESMDNLSASGPLLLYKCQIPLAIAPRTVRFFIWHQNASATETMKIGLYLQASSELR